MLWPYPRVRRPRDVDVRRRVAEVRGEHPESETWLTLLEAALGETEDGAIWAAAVPRPAAGRPVNAPLLFRTEMTVDQRRASGWVRRLLRLSGAKAGARVDAVALLEAAVCQDYARIDALADEFAADASALRVIAQLAAIPLLQACGRALAGEVPASWGEGYCPVCGAWPIVAESVGIERKRRARCGRCGTAWSSQPLRCVYCNESHHEHLGYLTPEESEATRTVEVCKTCKGYLKGLTTVRALAPWAVLLDDLTSVHLDLVALERGYQRPERPAYPLEARIR